MRKGKRLPLDVLAPYLLELPLEPRHLSWPQVFGNTNPVELEIGFGKGLFLVTASQRHPDVNFVGVEIDRGLQLYAANRIAKRQLRNVRLVEADARHFVASYIAAGTLQAIHVYFPDPWWKTRHKKRRVFTAEFAVECQRALAPGGRLYIMTDVEEYFGVMTGLVAENTKLRRVEDAEPSRLAADDVYLTNFERKALQRGGPVFRAVYEKVSVSG